MNKQNTNYETKIAKLKMRRKETLNCFSLTWMSPLLAKYTIY